MAEHTRRSVLFVCLGNICRSPLAEGVFRWHVERAGLSDRIFIDSAGTGDWHVGDPPDPRAQACARRNGIDISNQRARQFEVGDFDRFDRILAMDETNRRDILRLARNEADRRRVRLLLDYAPHQPSREVPDPYFGGEAGFQHVFSLIDTACRNLIAEIRRELVGG